MLWVTKVNHSLCTKRSGLKNLNYSFHITLSPQSSSILLWRTQAGLFAALLSIVSCRPAGPAMMMLWSSSASVPVNSMHRRTISHFPASSWQPSRQHTVQVHRDKKREWEMHCNCSRPSLSLPDKEWRKERLNCFDIAHSIFSVHIKIMFGEYKYDRPNNINNSPYSFLMDRQTGPQNAEVEGDRSQEAIEWRVQQLLLLLPIIFWRRQNHKQVVGLLVLRVDPMDHRCEQLIWVMERPPLDLC